MTTRVHILGICGIGMAGLAARLAGNGFSVTGSDSAVAPPASDLLEAAGIEVRVGYRPWEGPSPDAVVVGNVIRSDNPELVSLKSHPVPVLSLPEAVNRFILQGVSTVVVAGTHGKTTTTALIAHGFKQAGRSPRTLVGGLLRGEKLPFNGSGDIGVVEGDEYDTAFFDKKAKLLHYLARWAVLTDLEFDHADIYSSLEAIERVFRTFLHNNLDPEAEIVYRRGSKILSILVKEVDVPALSFGPEKEADIRWEIISRGPGWTEASLAGKGIGEKLRFRWNQMGDHNLANAAAAAAVWKSADLSLRKIEEALSTFPGVVRRLEVVLDGPVTIIDDFAHHPTAVEATLRTLRAHYPGRGLLAVFEPRSATSRRKIFTNQYIDSLSSADEVFLLPPTRQEKIPPDERLDVFKVRDGITSRGTKAEVAGEEDLPSKLIAAAGSRPSPVIVIMTSGPSRWLIESLVEVFGNK